MFGFFGIYKAPPPIPDDKKVSLRYGELNGEDLYALRWAFIFDEPSVFAEVSRDNIIGIDHTLNELDRYVKLIKNFSHLDDQGPELDTGMIFTGPPGSGKTFCARYLATQSEARFINVSDFPRKRGRFLADDIAELFGLMKQYVANKNQPIIAFWDEFETLTTVGEDAEKIEALARFKTELSGIKGKLRGVFIIAATNQPQQVPEDITRGGRLGKKIKFTSLKRGAKQSVLQHFVNRHNHSEDIGFESLSYLISANFPADIEEVVNEAWRNAYMKTMGTDEKPCLTNEILVYTLLRQARGAPEDIILSDEELRAIAIYEIGRAIITRTFKFPAQFIALEKIGYPDAYHATDTENHSAHTPLKRLYDEIAIRYGGMIAQEMCDIEPNSKQIPDFMTITTLAQNFVERLRLADFETSLSISAIAEARANQKLPTAIGLAENLMFETREQMADLIERQRIRVRTIFDHYGAPLLEISAKHLIEKGYMLQMDIDALLDPEFIPPLNNLENTNRKKRPGF